MRSSESSSLRSKAEQSSSEGKCASRTVRILVLSMRVVVGLVFIVSGLSKLVDLWGTVFKIEDYVAVWGLDVPRTVIMMGGMALSTFEFSAGLLLMAGCYKRVVTWGLMACMSFMLPLTLYVWIADPVSDCGCFGDFLIIGNGVTFFKNVVLTAMVVYLMIYNKRVGGLYSVPIQWIVGVLVFFYCITVALIGYNIQPMVDFRPFKIGEPLVDASMDAADDVIFRYSRDGEIREFDADELPDESDGWEFVERVESRQARVKQLDVYDPATGDDVTMDYLAGSDSLLILVIPEPARADLSCTYTINELADRVTDDGGDFVALLATGDRGIERWKDHSMASYPCLEAEDTQLKELSRGVMSMVWVTNDTVRWKRTVASISLEETEAVSSGSMAVGQLGFDGLAYMWRLSMILVAVLVLLYVFQAAVVKLVKLVVKDVAQVENVH